MHYLKYSVHISRHLATGESYRSLAFQFRVSHSWISVMIREVASAIILRLAKKAIPSPTTEQLEKSSQAFSRKWNFPNCVGAIDGKHIRMKAPKKSGSLFFNYKEYFSMVVLAVVDAEYKFLAVDVGSYGKEGDAGIYLKSQIGRQINNNCFGMPAPAPLPGTKNVVPHVIVGDEAFALHENLMKPYPRPQSLQDDTKGIFNYRLSRARRTTENAFGILSNYFRVFFQPIATEPKTTEKIIVCALILHNILRESKILAPGQKHLDDKLELPTENLIDLADSNVRYPTRCIAIRETFKSYFNGPGAVAWQTSYVSHH